MADTWREPYQVVIEVENKQCKMVGKLAALGFKHLKVVDVRSSSSGSVRHLMDVGADQANKVPKELAAKGRVEGKSSVWLEARAVKSVTPYSRTMHFWCQVKACRTIS